jgi:hypothetical protein
MLIETCIMIDKYKQQRELQVQKHGTLPAYINGLDTNHCYSEQDV